MAKRKIEQSRAIVTGASSGIGRAIALELARQGARQVLVARREERLAELAAEIRAQGDQGDRGQVELVAGDVTEASTREKAFEVELVAGDVTEASTREKAFETVQSAFGGLDVLVNNAGVGAMGPFDQGDPGRVRRIMEVNFFALVEMVRRGLPLLKQGTDPIIVNVSSILGHRGAPYSSEYSASKFAVQGFSEALRAELSRQKIDVLVVSPGTTETEFFDNVLEHTGDVAWPHHAPVSAAHVARETVRAIRKGRHEIIPYRWGRVLCWLNRLSPGLVDRAMARFAKRSP